MVTCRTFFPRGTRWDYTSRPANHPRLTHVATRHDAVAILVGEEHDRLFANFGDLEVDNEHWRDKSIEHMMDAVDNRFPPRERLFWCSGCRVPFSRPPRTAVTFFIDRYSDLRASCGARCLEKITATGGGKGTVSRAIEAAIVAVCVVAVVGVLFVGMIYLRGMH